MIRVEATVDGVEAVFSHNDTEVRGTGGSLTEAVENLIIRFKQLQDAAFSQLREYGFIRVERASAEEAS